MWKFDQLVDANKAKPKNTADWNFRLLDKINGNSRHKFTSLQATNIYR